MKALRQILGLLWLVLGPVTIIALLLQAAAEIGAKPTQENYVFWIIIISIFTPIAAGLSIFGWYAWGKEFDWEEHHRKVAAHHAAKKGHH